MNAKFLLVVILLTACVGGGVGKREFKGRSKSASQKARAAKPVVPVVENTTTPTPEPEPEPEPTKTVEESSTSATQDDDKESEDGVGRAANYGKPKTKYQVKEKEIRPLPVTPTPGSPKKAGNKNPDDEDEDPVPDPFYRNEKWTAFVLRMDAMGAALEKLTSTLPTLLSSSNPEYSADKEAYLRNFGKGFAKKFNELTEFFYPAQEQLIDGAAYTQINPAIGLTSLEKLTEWAQRQPDKPLDKDRYKWVEVNGYAITAHYVFDRLNHVISKWGLEDIKDVETISYPTWLKEVSGYDGSDKPTYELKDLTQLIRMIDYNIDNDGEKRHMMRSLEKILRNYISGWDPNNDENIYCFGNNDFGIIHDIFDLLIDAAMYLSLADMKTAVLQSTLELWREWELQTSTELVDSKKSSSKIKTPILSSSIFANMTTRINRKIRIAELATVKNNILPGPVTFKCDRSPENNGEELPQPPGKNKPKKQQLRPGGSKPVYPVSQWGVLPEDLMSPIAKGPMPNLDPQAGPQHPPPIGYIDKRHPNFDFASFSQAYMGYLEAEQVLNPDGSCKSTCPDFRRPFATCQNKSIDCPGIRNSYCEPGKPCMEQSNCDKAARKCIRTSYEVSFCPAAPDSGRAYDWVEINGTLVGKQVDDGKTDCKKGIGKLRERWEMDFGVIVNAPQYCEVCMCVCDGPMNPEGVHYVDIQAVTASPGFVITSLKFNQKDNILRLMAEEGKMTRDGYIEEGSLKWIKTEVVKKGEAGKTVQLGGEKGGFKKMGLDMVYAAMNSVITGIKFELSGDELHLSARSTPVNQVTNELDSSAGNSVWVQRNYPTVDPNPKKINLDDKVNPTKQLGPGQPFNIPENNRVIQFDASSLELDAGQTVIPYFDLQPVRHHTVKKPLNAVGIMYKSKRGFGGFLSPAITPYRKSYLPNK